MFVHQRDRQHTRESSIRGAAASMAASAESCAAGGHEAHVLLSHSHSGFWHADVQSEFPKCVSWDAALIGNQNVEGLLRSLFPSSSRSLVDFSAVCVSFYMSRVPQHNHDQYHLTPSMPWCAAPLVIPPQMRVTVAISALVQAAAQRSTDVDGSSLSIGIVLSPWDQFAKQEGWNAVAPGKIPGTGRGRRSAGGVTTSAQQRHRATTASLSTVHRGSLNDLELGSPLLSRGRRTEPLMSHLMASPLTGQGKQGGSSASRLTPIAASPSVPLVNSDSVRHGDEDRRVPPPPRPDPSILAALNLLVQRTHEWCASPHTSHTRPPISLEHVPTDLLCATCQLIPLSPVILPCCSATVCGAACATRDDTKQGSSSATVRCAVCDERRHSTGADLLLHHTQRETMIAVWTKEMRVLYRDEIADVRRGSVHSYVGGVPVASPAMTSRQSAPISKTPLLPSPQVLTRGPF